MRNLVEINKTSTRRPYWLLLALLLFFAGQIAAAAHWHDEANVIDADCALCVLSSATGAAITAAALTFAGLILCTFILTETARVIARPCAHAYDSRAPPQHA